MEKAKEDRLSDCIDWKKMEQMGKATGVLCIACES